MYLQHFHSPSLSSHHEYFVSVVLHMGLHFVMESNPRLFAQVKKVCIISLHSLMTAGQTFSSEAQ
jgi:hypothetical protein